MYGALFNVTIARIRSKHQIARRFQISSALPHSFVLPPVLRSGPARKRPRPLEEAVKAGDGVALKFSESFAVDNQNLVLLQVRFVLSSAAG